MTDTIYQNLATEVSITRPNDFKLAADPSNSKLPQYSYHDNKFDTELGKDDALLASLGYKAELKREFTAFEVFGLIFSLIGLLPSIASTLVYSMPAGGPVGMVLSVIIHWTYSRFGGGLLLPVSSYKLVSLWVNWQAACRLGYTHDILSDF
jgi:hypothetical protein